MLTQIAQLVGDNACIACHIAEVEACNNELRQQISICEAMRQDAVASNEQLSKDVKLLATRLLVIVNHLCSCFSLAQGPFDISNMVHIGQLASNITLRPVVQLVSSICCSE